MRDLHSIYIFWLLGERAGSRLPDKTKVSNYSSSSVYPGSNANFVIGKSEVAEKANLKLVQ